MGILTACGPDPGIACRLAWDISHDAGLTQTVRVYLAGPAGQTGRILFVVALALAARAIALRLVRRITERAARTAPLAAAVTLGKAHPGTERREQRARALGSILRSAISVVIFAIAALTILGDLGINLAPLLASTAVLGVALGFGAQNLVRDYLAGVLMLVEDHYGVGDVVNVGDVTGTVEAMTLLSTQLRDEDGVVWHIRNGTIESAGNESKGWSRAVIDYPVPYESDLPRVRAVMEQATAGMRTSPRWRDVLLEDPEVWGAQELSSAEVTMRIVARTAPLRQWEVARDLRDRVKAALDAAGIVQARPEIVAISVPGRAGPDGDDGDAGS